MMAALRAFAKSGPPRVLFALTGGELRDLGRQFTRRFHMQFSDAVVKAGSREVRSADFKQLFTQDLQQYQQQTGQTSRSTRRSRRASSSRRSKYGNQDSMLEAIRRSGVQASDQQVLDQIRKIPAFFNPVTGAFDEPTYEQLLASHNLTPLKFQQDLRDQLSESYFNSAIRPGSRSRRPMRWCSLRWTSSPAPPTISCWTRAPAQAGQAHRRPAEPVHQENPRQPSRRPA